MIYSIDDLFKMGGQFPPKIEIKRRDAYRVNDMLLNDEAWNALPEYKQRVFTVLNNFNLSGKMAYFYDANYWQDLVEKFQELIYGDAPEYSAGNEAQTETLIQTIEGTDFTAKITEGLADFVALGDWVTKVYTDANGEMQFINVDPAMWFPIVSVDNVKEVKAHVLAWLVPIKGDKWELHVQVHEKGKYTNRAFMVDKYEPDAWYKDAKDGRRINCPLATIGVELEKSATDFSLGEFQTGLDDFAIIASANNAKTRTLYGSSDFDKITESAMEYNVRMTLKNVVLDKHSAPILCGAPLAGDGESDIGNYIEVLPGGTTPNYLVWDASMQSVENTILKAQEDVANLSGLGSLLSSKTFGESQGYDALMIKLAPALMKTAQKRSVLEAHLKRLLSLLSKGYGQQVPARDITIGWKDGIPATEGVRADIAQKHLATGWSTFDVLTKDYGWTADAAEMAIERKKDESPQLPIFGAYDETPTDEGGGNA
jgi:hypothetical protein